MRKRPPAPREEETCLWERTGRALGQEGESQDEDGICQPADRGHSHARAPPPHSLQAVGPPQASSGSQTPSEERVGGPT